MAAYGESNRTIKISPSSLAVYLECPRCFWLRFNEGIQRPGPPMSTLPSGVDYTLKAYFDEWRKKDGMPPLLKGKLPSKLLADQSLISKFRSRTFGFSDKKLNAYFSGILDDALELEGGYIVPLDNKTRGFPPREPHEAHVNQMSAYSLILKENGIKTKSVAYLVYWFFNHKDFDLEKPLEFNISVEEVKTDPERARANFEAAVQTLRGEMPPPETRCRFCAYRQLGY